MNRLIGWIQLMAARLGEKCFQRTHKQFRIFPLSLPLFRSRYFVFFEKLSGDFKWSYHCTVAIVGGFELFQISNLNCEVFVCLIDTHG